MLDNHIFNGSLDGTMFEFICFVIVFEYGFTSLF